MAGPALILTAVTPANTISLNLSNYLQLQPGTQMDPYNPSFTNKVFSHSLLKEGGTLALESLALKELQFPLRLKAATSTGLAELIQQLNQVINSPGATASWQDEGMANPTYFDLVSGQFDITYTFREAAQHFQAGLLRLFSQPLGRKAGPRAFAAASGVGPLLMISPYASGGALAIAASEQAGVAGFGGKQQPSGGVFYWGNPSLAGDVGSLLQVSYVGPLPNTASNAGVVPNVAVSILPDQNYRPLVTVPEVSVIGTASRIADRGAVASEYLTAAGETGKPGMALYFSVGASPQSEPTSDWAGSHRLFAIARASSHAGFLSLERNALVPFATAATVNPGDWRLCDLGTLTLRASEPPIQRLNVLAEGGPGGGSVDVTAFVILPDSSTWYLSGTGISPSQYGFPEGIPQLAPSAPYTNTLLLDDVLGDQFIYAGASQSAAPSPLGAVPSAARITQFARALVPRPEPRRGMPIIAVLGVGQVFTGTTTIGGGFVAGGSWTNPQNLRTMAQVTVLERFRYISG